jgi:hypothetical protein
MNNFNKKDSVFTNTGVHRDTDIYNESERIINEGPDTQFITEQQKTTEDGRQNTEAKLLMKESDEKIRIGIFKY